MSELSDSDMKRIAGAVATCYEGGDGGLVCLIEGALTGVRDNATRVERERCAEVVRGNVPLPLPGNGKLAGVARTLYHVADVIEREPRAKEPPNDQT